MKISAQSLISDNSSIYKSRTYFYLLVDIKFMAYRLLLTFCFDTLAADKIGLTFEKLKCSFFYLDLLQ